MSDLRIRADTCILVKNNVRHSGSAIAKIHHTGDIGRVRCRAANIIIVGDLSRRSVFGQIDITSLRLDIHLHLHTIRLTSFVSEHDIGSICVPISNLKNSPVGVQDVRELFPAGGQSFIGLQANTHVCRARKDNIIGDRKCSCLGRHELDSLALAGHDTRKRNARAVAVSKIPGIGHYCSIRIIGAETVEINS